MECESVVTGGTQSLQATGSRSRFVKEGRQVGICGKRVAGDGWLLCDVLRDEVARCSTRSRCHRANFC